MTLQGGFDSRVSRRLIAGVFVAVLHVSVFFAITRSGGRHDGIYTGDTPIMQLVLLEASDADHSEGLQLPPLLPAVPNRAEKEEQQSGEHEPALPGVNAPAAELVDAEVPPADAPTHEITETPADEPIAPVVVADALPATLAMTQTEQSALLQQIMRHTEELSQTQHAQVTWDADGKQYSAALVLERANDGVQLDRVIAQISAADRGKVATTRLKLKRLAFSQYAQMIDRWNPRLQLHDDEIVGRFHSNTKFSLLDDPQTAPKFIGKVTTSARSFNEESIGNKPESPIFQGGVETHAGRITLPRELQPFAWSPQADNAHVYELAKDTRIRFFGDGSYTWRVRDAESTGYSTGSGDQPVYFIAARGATVYVRGTLAGRILIYSPDTIVIEGTIKYAHDPRQESDSPDYLGLVCDHDIEIASSSVTGLGDLEIDAAIFAGHHFYISDINHNRPATMRIFGSLVAGSLTASEPRYALRIEYDGRFENQRPPGFPSTNQFTVEDWDRRWTEAQ
jgi:hypothetical protein